MLYQTFNYFNKQNVIFFMEKNVKHSDEPTLFWLFTNRYFTESKTRTELHVSIAVDHRFFFLYIRIALSLFMNAKLNFNKDHCELLLNGCLVVLVKKVQVTCHRSLSSGISTTKPYIIHALVEFAFYLCILKDWDSFQ